MMNIKHIINRNILDSWTFYSEMEKMFEESSSEIYSLMIYRNKNISDLEYKYQLVSPRNEGYQYTTILKTDSKEEVKINLNLIGLRIKKVNIFMQEKSNEDKIIPCTIIYLKV